MSVDEDTILLLGGSSFLGLQTAQTLFYYFDIVCTYNQSIVPKFFPEFNWFQLNFSSKNESIKTNLKRLIEKTNTTFLVNFAGITTPLKAKNEQNLSQKINVLANQLIAQVCAETDTIPIFISTDHVFSGEEGPYSEEFDPNPLKNSVYGQQKKLAEKIYQQIENYAIIRVSTTLGLNLEFQKQNIYQKAVSNLSTGKKIAGAGNKIRTASHCYNVPFLINKIVEAFNEKRIENGIFHVPGELLTEYELLLKIADTFDFERSLIEKTQIDNNNDSYPLRLGLDSSKTIQKLHGKFLTLDESLKLLKFDFLN